jgi:glycosyltransferase involved in cell wall biosynthesis
MQETSKTEGAVSSVSVFFPCYNEEGNMRLVYESANRVLKNIGIDYEIIFVDDGSTDNTLKIIKEIAATDDKVKIVHHPSNLGYGAALQSGFRIATKTYIFFTDSDLQFDFNEFPSLLPSIQHCEIVSCFRIKRHEGPLRKFNSWCWTVLMRLLFDVKVKDVNCAFKLFRKEVFDGMKLCSSSALINAEILARAHRQGFRIIQMGVRHYPRKTGRPTGASLNVILKAFWELICLRREILRG